jgi:hypothetical protein
MNPAGPFLSRRAVALILGAALVVCGALLLPRPASRPPAAQASLYEEASSDVPEALTAALRHEETLAAYETVQIQALAQGMTLTLTRRRMKLPQGGLAEQATRVFAGRTSGDGRVLTTTDVTVLNESGRWRLFPGAAIKYPGMETASIGAVLAEVPQSPRRASRYLVRSEPWNDRVCTVVVRIEHPDTVAQHSAALRHMVARQQAAVEGGTKTESHDPESFAVARTEYYVDPTLNFVVRRHTIAGNGQTITDEACRTVNLAPSFSPADFAIPADATLHFPKDMNEYTALSRHYTLMSRINQNPKTVLP